MLSIRSNISSLEAQRHIAGSQRDLGLSFQRLSSGYRINSAADDAAGLAITESLEAQTRSYAVAQRNSADGISMAETADGAAGQMSALLGRLRELAVQASNGSLQTSDRTNLNTEFTSVRSEIDRIANVTTYNGVALLNSSANAILFQIGIGTTSNDRIAITFGGLTSTILTVNNSTVETFTNAQASITSIDAAINLMATARETFGASINRMQVAVTNLQAVFTNTNAAKSRIRDVDVAEETSKLARFQVLQQAGAAVLTQANQAPQLALALLRG